MRGTTAARLMRRFISAAGLNRTAGEKDSSQFVVLSSQLFPRDVSKADLRLS